MAQAVQPPASVDPLAPTRMEGALMAIGAELKVGDHRLPAPARFLISDLCTFLEGYLDPAEIREVYRAYLFGAEAHEGQTRVSGEPYIYHPLAVARIMAELRMDVQSLVAGILHDVIEDTPTAKEQLVREFGQEVADLVDGVSKLTHLTFQSRAEAQAESFRKMMLAMVRDLRVIMIKLADRLHNMRTLSAMPPDKQRRIARETLEIYAPIALRLGINSLRLELEQLGFQALYPLRCRRLDKAVRASRGNRKALIAGIEAQVCQRLEEVGIEGRVLGREKSLYSIYKKMHQKKIRFREISDVFALRIVVHDIDACYRTLGLVHNLYKPILEKFKDYIAIPKANGYQSIHTGLIGPHGISLEVQIRTLEMDQAAEAGIAAHWLYKAGDKLSARTQARARAWIKDILELQNSAASSIEFLESVKTDLFPDEVYVFTPAGEIIKLPRGATGVDYAYAVHTDVGNACAAIKVDRRLVPFSTVLQSGQSVEVITTPGKHPDPSWLDFVVTAKARTNIRAFLKSLQHQEAISLGRRLLNEVLRVSSQDLEYLDASRIDGLLRELGAQSLDEIFMDIGLGNRRAPLVAHCLISPRDPVTSSLIQPSPLVIRGTEGLVLSFAKCCYPIPGDPVVGLISAGRGLVIHRATCRNVAPHLDKPDKYVPVQWSPEPIGEYTASIRVLSGNRRGALASLAARIANESANIEKCAFEERQGGVATSIKFLINVKDRQHLARIMRTLRISPNVFKVVRICG